MEKIVWRDLLIYEHIKSFLGEKRFGFIFDMRRAANSIVHNIAKGFGRYESRGIKAGSIKFHGATLMNCSAKF
jgi:four helix bundle protein